MTALQITSPAFELALPDPDATTRLGTVLARSLTTGDTVLLGGQIGAGKSHLARALIQARAEQGGDSIPDVPSPTYTLVQPYALTTGDILHADLYRLGDTSELAELGLEDAFGRALCLVEWPDRMGTLAPPDAIRITLHIDGEGRRATIQLGTEDAAHRLAPLFTTGGAP